MEWESQKNEGQEYYNFMLQWLGKEEFTDLIKRGRSIMKESTAIMNAMHLLK